MKKILLISLVSLISLLLCVTAFAEDSTEVYFDTQVSRKIVGETLELNVIGAADNAVITFDSADSTIASVDNSGKVTAKSSGDTYISATVDGVEIQSHIFVLADEIAPVPFTSKDYSAGKTYVVASLGDSITNYAYDLAPNESTIVRGYNYHDYWAKDYKVKNHNYGVGWSMVSNAPHPENIPSFIKRLPGLISGVPTADLITVMGGTNDFSSVSLDDVSSRDLETFTGAIRHIMENLIEAYPQKQIVFFGQTRTGASTNALDKENKFGDSKYDYVARIEELAEIYGVKFIDLYSVDELDFRDKFDYIAKDNVHPNKEGQRLMGIYMAEQMDAIGAIDIQDPVIIDSGDCGENLTWSIDHRNNLLIAGTGDMYDYTAENPAPWAEFYDTIVSVEIEATVTSIGDYAFAGFPLTATVIGAGVTSIGDYAFKGSALTGANITGKVNSIGEGAFDSCASLHTVVITAEVTSIGDDAFAGCADDFVLRAADGSYTQTYATENSVNFTLISNKIGDADGDDDVDTADMILLARYVANWENITVVTDNCDLDMNGEVGPADSVIMKRHWADWEAYKELPYIPAE